MQTVSKKQKRRQRIEDEFKHLLKSKWTRPVACQNECQPRDSCSCQRKIVHVYALERWWNEQHPESPGQTRGHRFLDETPPAPHRTFQVKYQNIFIGEQSCRRVLSLLLEQGHHHLIERFYRADINDRYLVRSEDDRHLRESLLEVHTRKEVDRIIQEFHRDKWAYCPLNLTLDMDVNLHGTKVILPFCGKIKLPDKGGTASIYWVAVQKDLITDSALTDALQKSLYEDDDFGECYQMVLKSYCGNKKRDFELEKEAFSGLDSKKDVPILRCLGSYTHDYGEEYGDHDLYQAWADETNVPPVRAQEILRTWDSLFEIAKAIRHVHHLEVPRGGESEPRRFHGWHADIKPDNILSIRKKLKLADFGFSSFAPVIEGHDSSVPTELIRGFTDTYGAPEVFRMRNPDGTFSGVSQSIDTWSFGCVLSVAATWIVLGFQGIRQYEQLRQLAPTNCENGEIHDRFHNGLDVLPEIQKWHNYLRGHLRPSDTTTERVLVLVEDELLQADLKKRPDSEKLCEKLQEIRISAEKEISRLKGHSKETDAVVLKALSEIEDKARIQRVSETKMKFSRQEPIPAGASQINPRQWASMQVRKEEMIKSKPLGQTPYRKEILRQELKASSHSLSENKEHMLGVHNGAVTESPVENADLYELPFSGRSKKPRNPDLQESDQHKSDTQRNTTDSEPDRPIAAPSTPTPTQRRNKVHDQKTFVLDVTAPTTDSFREHDNPNLRKSDRVVEKISETAFRGSSSSTGESTSVAPPLPQINTHIAPLSPPYTPGFKASGNTIHLELSPLEQHAQTYGTMQSSDPRPKTSSTISSAYGDKQVYDPISTPTRHADDVTTFDAKHPLGIFQSPTVNEHMKAQYPSENFDEKHAMKSHRTTMSHETVDFVQAPPASVLYLPYSICERRRKLENEKQKRLAKLASKMGKETRKPDPNLKDISKDRRELVFVIDNGWTMFEHWPILTFVVETLAMNAAGIDKSGIDLRFTVEGSRHNASDIVGENGRRVLKEKLRAAWPEHKPKPNATTDMTMILENIYKEWHRNRQPATTLYVFTDGKWSTESLTALRLVAKNPNSHHDIILNPPPLHKAIMAFAEQDRQQTGNRHFSIQFIRFGDNAPDTEHLQWLDDHLCESHKYRDIIDHCSWRATVDKIFKGSIEGFLDEKDTKEPPVLYNYKQLVETFDRFNRGEEDGPVEPHNATLSSPLMRAGTHRSVVSTSSPRTQQKRFSMFSSP
ncbi:hypothetical protein J3E71DRAFT_399644 [Bipolaris maydis]|nr:hypothetical protein J3E71DRAFT_399644 [Bipolaris maydis]